ncbi:MAG: hypothetical protein AABX74_05050 [Nanoarchaeota archaeon]
MVQKRLNKKGQDASSSYKYLLTILLVLAIAIALYFILRSIGNAVLPK